MNLNSCDDWGWYVDIENADISNQYNYNISKNKNNEKNIKNNNHYSSLETIEYLYKQDNENTSNLIYKVGSTTIITALLTYFILFVV